jgi:hypothetical protein
VPARRIGIFALRSLTISLFLICVLETSLYSATQKIYLLTALDDDPRIDLTQLDGIFRKPFATDFYELSIKHKATQYDLWQALHSYQTIAIFWLSHAGCTEFDVPDYAMQLAMPDFNHFDAAGILQEIHPNLRFLGVIACNSNLVIKKISSEYDIQTRNPDLEIKAFDQKISAENGLLEAIEIAKLVIRNKEFQKGYPVRSCPSYKGYPMRISRRVPTDPRAALFPPLRVETSGGKILGMFKGEDQNFNQEEDIEIFFPLLPSSKRVNLGLIMEIGRIVSSSATPVHGHIEVLSSWEGAGWRMNAALQGITTHILTYTGTLNLNEAVNQQVKYEPFDCSPMPPLTGPRVPLNPSS